MKKIIITVMCAATMLFGGCKYDKVGANDGKPVSPKEQSYERSDAGEPQLPYMEPWWK